MAEVPPYFGRAKARFCAGQNIFQTQLTLDTSVGPPLTYPLLFNFVHLLRKLGYWVKPGCGARHKYTNEGVPT